jgi:hypothetical protein
MPKFKGSAADVGARERRLTVARVHEKPDHATVKFLESARIYRMPRTNPDYARALRDLRMAAASGTAVHVRLLEPNGDVIESIAPRGRA